jgi:hypothetical protein
MTVTELEQRMSNAEFVRWMVYHGRRAQDQELAMKKGR